MPLPLYGRGVYGATAYAGPVRPAARRGPGSSRRILARFSIGRPDGQTWEDLTGYLATATVSLGDVSSVGTGNAGIDERVRTAEFVLAQDRAGALGASLSPRDRNSAWNQWGGQYAPLIWPGREVYFEVALVPLTDSTESTTTYRGRHIGTGDGQQRTFYLGHHPVVLGAAPLRIYLDGAEQQDGYSIDPASGTVTFDEPPAAGVIIRADYTYWLPLFHGLIDDWQTAGSTITIRCRDLAARLMDAYILEPREYGSEAGTPLEQVIQQILDDNLGAGVVQLYCPESPGFAVTPYIIEYCTVWEAIQRLAAQTVGWYLGYRWHPATGRFELMLLEPPRNKDASSADWHLTAVDGIYVVDLGGSIADVRNKVLVVYRDSATGERRTVVAEDPASQAEYGVRAMQIEEADTSLIDTEEEARALAQAAVADLKDQHATARLELPLLPMLDLMDGIALEDPRTSSTVDFYAVESVEHRLDWSDPERAILRTTAVCSGRVAGAHTRWLAMQTRLGARGAPTAPERIVGGGRVLPTPPTPQVRPIICGIAVDVPAPSVNAHRWAKTQVVVSTTSGFDPDSVTPAAEGRSSHFEIATLEPGGLYYVRARYVGPLGETSAWSPEASAEAAYPGSFLLHDIKHAIVLSPPDFAVRNGPDPTVKPTWPIQKIDEWGAWIDIPGATATVTLDEPSVVHYILSGSGSFQMAALASWWIKPNRQAPPQGHCSVIGAPFGTRALEDGLNVFWPTEWGGATDRQLVDALRIRMRVLVDSVSVAEFDLTDIARAYAYVFGIQRPSVPSGDDVCFWSYSSTIEFPFPITISRSLHIGAGAHTAKAQVYVNDDTQYNTWFVENLIDGIDRYLSRWLVVQFALVFKNMTGFALVLR